MGVCGPRPRVCYIKSSLVFNFFSILHIAKLSYLFFSVQIKTTIIHSFTETQQQQFFLHVLNRPLNTRLTESASFNLNTHQHGHHKVIFRGHRRFHAAARQFRRLLRRAHLRPRFFAATAATAGGAVPPAGERAPDDARAVDAGPGGRGGAIGGAAERLGVFEAGGGSGHRVELRVCGCGGGRAGFERERSAGHASEVVDCRVRYAMRPSHGLRLRRV